MKMLLEIDSESRNTDFIKISDLILNKNEKKIIAIDNELVSVRQPRDFNRKHKR